MPVTKISVGFLDGNIGDVPPDEFAEWILDMLYRKYPGAEITVKHQRGEGCRPAYLQTLVTTDRTALTHEDDDVSSDYADDIDNDIHRLWRELQGAV